MTHISCDEIMFVCFDLRSFVRVLLLLLYSMVRSSIQSTSQLIHINEAFADEQRQRTLSLSVTFSAQIM